MTPEKNRFNASKPLALIQKYYPPTSGLYHILVTHSFHVAAKAHEIALAFLNRNPEAALDLDFIAEAAMLHDIGILRCHAPKILCTGEEPYIKHGIIGREMLEQEGLPRHALVCERHTGVGMTRTEVVQQNLPLPGRDYLPLSLEEKIICLADRFYVKEPDKLSIMLSRQEIREKISRFGAPALARWETLCRLFLPDDGQR